MVHVPPQTLFHHAARERERERLFWGGGHVERIPLTDASNTGRLTLTSYAVRVNIQKENLVFKSLVKYNLILFSWLEKISIFTIQFHMMEMQYHILLNLLSFKNNFLNLDTNLKTEYVVRQLRLDFLVSLNRLDLKNMNYYFMSN